MNTTNQNETKTCSPRQRVYSDKIKDRRRALFPSSEHNDTELGANPLNLDAGHEYQNISEIASTEFIRKLLDTPEKKKNSSDMDVSSCKNSEDNDSISSLSLAEILKTPNDSSTSTENAPKISRKSVSGISGKEDSSISSGNKTSKVRTTLFRETDISVPTESFYTAQDSSINKTKVLVGTNVSSRGPKYKINSNARTRKSRLKKRLFGQINAGVRHKIRKRIYNTPKISNTSVSHIKTYKSDFSVNKNLDGFFQDLKEINENKKIKQILHMPGTGQSSSTEIKKNTSLKKQQHDNKKETSFKTFRTNGPELLKTSSDSSFDNDQEEEIALPIEKILTSLNESVGEDKENQSRNKEGILSPSAELSNMTLGLKLGSPIKAQNLTTVFQNMADSNILTSSENKKSPLFPLFYPQKRSAEKAFEKDIPTKKKKIKLSADQMLLDAGQKKFGLHECAECNYVYNAGDPNDENLHEKHHYATDILRFNGWKHERIIEEVVGKIIQILPGDSKQWIEKVKRLSEYINREMGYYNMDIDLSRTMVFLYIFNKSIIGCIMAESKTSANKMLTANIDVDLCSLEEYPVVCGVSRLWVAQGYRKKGIATKLMETLRMKFLPDRIIEKSEICISAPTPEGKLFATKYFETQNFYTYMN